MNQKHYQGMYLANLNVNLIVHNEIQITNGIQNYVDARTKIQ